MPMFVASRKTGHFATRSALGMAAALAWVAVQACGSSTPSTSTNGSGGTTAKAGAGGNAGSGGAAGSSKPGSGGQAGLIGSGGMSAGGTSGGGTNAGGTNAGGTNAGGANAGGTSGGGTSGGGTNAGGASGGGTRAGGTSGGDASMAGAPGSGGALSSGGSLGADVGADGTDTVSVRPDSGIQAPPKDSLYTPPFDPSTVPSLMPLFDGKTLTGWNCNPNTWHVVDGALVGTGQGEFCVTKASYSTVRIFVSTKTDSDHQGIGFWGPQPPAGKWDNGSVACLDVMPPNNWTWDYVTNAGIATKAGGISNTPAQQLMKEWTQAEILLTRATGRIRMAVNGALILDVYLDNLTRPKTEGPIGLQAHAANTKVYYKDIWAEVNPTDDRLISIKP